MRFAGVVLLLACVFPSQAEELSGETLVAALRGGGYVLYLRHGATQWGSQNDERMRSYDDCSTQRNLSDEGRQQARVIGENVRRLGIPIGSVLASPFCRTRDTARLAFGKAQRSPAVREGPMSPDDPKRYDALRRLLAKRPPKGTNTVIASHGNPLRAVAGPPHLAEGETAVIRPLGGLRFEVVAHIRAEDWALLAR